MSEPIDGADRWESSKQISKWRISFAYNTGAPVSLENPPESRLPAAIVKEMATLEESAPISEESAPGIGHYAKEWATLLLSTLPPPLPPDPP